MQDELLKVSSLNLHFQMENKAVQVLNNLSLTLAKGETLGLGGESGCGKSTLGKVLLRLLQPNSGSILFNGKELLTMSSRDLQKQRRHMQMIFQNPAASFNPKFSIKEILSEPYIIHQLEIKDQNLYRLLDQVGLGKHFLQRFPHQLSGGEKQRVAIARALALYPSLIICDEPFSALDGSVQWQIMDLLKNLQQEYQMAYLLISHDLSALRYFSDRLAIMYMGRFVEIGPTKEVYRQPFHPYTRALIAAVPIPDPRLERNRQPFFLHGELPGFKEIPKGCPFSSRCPYTSSICKEKSPEWKAISSNHLAACHLNQRD